MAPSVGPGASQAVRIPFDTPRPIPGAEYHLDVSFRLANPEGVLREGHEVAFLQFDLPFETPAPVLPLE